MDIQTRKINFVQEFLSLDDIEVIETLENTLLTEKTRLFNNGFKPMTIEELKAIIEESEDDVRNNRMIDVYQLKEEIKKWH